MRDIKHYEAWDTENDTCIFSGTNKQACINELLDYVTYQNHIDDSLYSTKDIQALNEEALNRIGIKFYINKY